MDQGDLQKLRRIAGLTQFAVSKASGIDRTRLSLAECGHVQLSNEEYATVKRTLVGEIQRRTLEAQNILLIHRR